MQISVCTKPLAIKLGLKWTKLTEATNMVTVNGQKRPTLGIVENFRWTLTNMFFEDLMKIGSYREFM